MKKVKLFPATELGCNTIRQVCLENRPPIAIYNLGGEYFATDDTCTHGEASLADGDIDGDEIVCPFHLGAFDIRSGTATRAPCEFDLGTYGVAVEDGTLYLMIGD